MHKTLHFHTQNPKITLLPQCKGDSLLTRHPWSAPSYVSRYWLRRCKQNH